VSTLQHLNLVQYYKGQYIICLTPEVLERHARSMSKRKVRIDPKCIKWTPKDWSKRGSGRLGALCCCILVLYMNYVCSMNLWTIYLAIFITGKFDCLSLFVLISNYQDL